MQGKAASHNPSRAGSSPARATGKGQAPSFSNLERALVAELREALKITDDRLIARGYAARLLPSAPSVGGSGSE